MSDTEYSKYETDYWWAVVRREIITDLIAKLVEMEGRDSGREVNALDIGCGSGANLAYLKRFGVPFGLEYHYPSVKRAAATGIGHVVNGNAASLPFQGDLFDVVSLQDVLEHLSRPEECMKEVNRVSRSGAVVVITVPAYQFLFNPVADEDHKKRYVAREIKELAEQSGFEIIRLSYFNTLLFPFMLVQRLIQKILYRRHNNVMDKLFPKYPSYFGGVFRFIFGLEKYWLRRLNFVYGGSVICICRKSR